MSISNPHPDARQRGVALVAALLLLIVITILGIATFRSHSFQQHIAGNTRDKSTAFQSSMDAQRHAEWYLTSNNGLNATAGSSCSGTMTTDQICSNVIQSDVQDVPWPSYVKYTPSYPATVTVGLPSQNPAFYISYLGNTGGSQGYQGHGITYNIYQIDAAGYGTSPGAVAVVESTYAVQVTRTSQQAPSGSSQVTTNVNQGGP